MADLVIPVRQLESLSVNNAMHNLKDQLPRLVYKRSEAAFAEGEAARDAIRTVPALKRRQRMVRAALLAAVGGLPPSNTPLRVNTTGCLDEKNLRIEKLLYESRPGTIVTANLYLPRGRAGKRGAVLFLCGHHAEAKHVREYQVVCRHLAEAGLVVLAQDPIGQGERFSYFEPGLDGTTVAWGTTEHDHAGAQSQLLGDSIARYFLHDSMRSLDVLIGRPEVDPRRIGVTGNSGGGTQTCLMMLADPRIAAAAPATFLMNRRSYLYTGGAQDSEQIWPGLTARGIDHEDILLAACPKPVCVMAVKYDFFPIEGTRETVSRCRRLWALTGHSDRLELVEDASTHQYTPALARAAARFFSTHLLGRKMAVPSAAIRPVEPSALWCTPSGQVRADFPKARAAYEENLDRLAILERNRRATPDGVRRKRAVAWLKKTIRSDRTAVTPNLRCHQRLYRVGDLLVDLGGWRSQEGVLNEGLLFRHIRDAGRAVPVTAALWDDGTRALSAHWDWLRATCGAGRAVLVFNVTGVAGGEPNSLNLRLPQEPYGALHKFNDDLAWLGDSLCALRAWDVTRIPAALAEWPGVEARGLRVFAHGRSGVYAELAAAVEPKLAAMEVCEPMAGFADWVRARLYDPYGSRAFVLPGVLTVADLPDLRKWRKKGQPPTRSGSGPRPKRQAAGRG